MGFAQAVFLLPFVLALAVRRRFKTRAKRRQSSSRQSAAASRTAVTDESGPRSRASLDCDSLTKLCMLLGENWLFPRAARHPPGCRAQRRHPQLRSWAAPGHGGHVSLPQRAWSPELTLPSWQTLIYTFRYC